MLFKYTSPQGYTYKTSSIVSAYLQNKFSHLTGKQLVNLRLRKKREQKRLNSLRAVTIGQLAANYLITAFTNVFILKPYTEVLELATEEKNIREDVATPSVVNEPIPSVKYVSFL